MSDDTIIVLCPIVHEKQSLQFCALHSLNNLLQLSSSSSSNYKNTTIEYENNQKKDGYSNSSKNVVVVVGIKDCHRWKNPKFSSSGGKPFTKNELDSIANRFIYAESKLFHNNNDNDDDDGILEENDDDSLPPPPPPPPQVSFLQSLKSNHRTPLTGNYSYEVMESALESKGIDLEWYNTIIQKQEETFQMEDENTTTTTTSNTIQHHHHHHHHNMFSMKDDDKHVIGFIIHKKETNNKSWFSKIPWIGSTIFHGGHHWFVITRIRSVQYTNTNNEHTTLANHHHSDNNPPLVYLEKDHWYLLDSQCSKPMDIGSNQNLFQYLQSIHKQGNSIFRASAKLTKVL